MTDKKSQIMTEDMTELLLWVPSGNPRLPILGTRLRYFYGSPAAIRDGSFSGAVFATFMALIHIHPRH